MPDRLATLIASATLNGIDFVEITRADQTGLRVHFLNRVAVAGTLTGSSPVTITGGEAIPAVPVRPIAATDWGLDDQGRPTLSLRTAFRGDFSAYRLRIASPALDPYFADVGFTFKAGCASALDCALPPACPPLPGGGPLVDYLAKDYTSFRAALLDYSARAYPQWVERDEPDLGMVLAEMLSAAGDELSYLQDRIAAEASLATATQRGSVVRHARLVDYEPRPATSARTLLQLDVAGGDVPAGLVVEAPLPDGGRIAFELGGGLDDTGPLRTDPRWNRLDHTSPDLPPRIVPYLWDDAQRCLRAGATELWVAGHGFGFPFDHLQLGTTGIDLLIDTAAPTPADPPVREIVHLTGASEEFDPLYQAPVTRLTWDARQALTADHALDRTVLAGNLVPASEGRRHTETFVIDPDPAGPEAGLAAVARAGPDAACGAPAPVYLHTLTAGRLAWLADEARGAAPLPEIQLASRAAHQGDQPQGWVWRRSLLDADPFEAAFTVEPAGYRDVRPTPAAGRPQWEYDGDDADSIRFGTGTFGDRPRPGSVFDVTYRVTAGAAGNVAADAITVVPPGFGALIAAATNPFPAAGGADEEMLDHVRAAAPRAFRSRQFRAVRAEDYTATALELPWVIDAGTAVRWTGSWLSIFTTALPAGTPDRGTEPTTDQRRALIELLGRRRMTGYEVFTPLPRYVGLDLVITVCAQPWALRGEVEAAVRAAVRTALFAPGRMRFGAPLERSDLEAAAQAAPGVSGVLSISYRRRGVISGFVPMPETVTVGRDEIIQVDDDPSRPDRGSIRIVVEGGK